MFRTSWKQLSLFSRILPYRGTGSEKKEKKKVKRHKVAKASALSDSYLYDIWKRLVTEYFPKRHDLLDYQVVWSNRNQKRTLASCNIHSQKVIVARELNHAPCHQWIEPLLYHEMCHAVMGKKVPKRNGKHQWHGREFKNLEKQHPDMDRFDLWIKEGGWSKAVRSDRSRQAHNRRKHSR